MCRIYRGKRILADSQEEERQKMWENEARLARVRKKRSEMQRKMKDKNDLKVRDKKDAEGSHMEIP